MAGGQVNELADGPTGCGTVARGGCLYAWNSVWGGKPYLRRWRRL